jgi:hypothetical protein
MSRGCTASSPTASSPDPRRGHPSRHAPAGRARTVGPAGRQPRLAARSADRAGTGRRGRSARRLRRVYLRRGAPREIVEVGPGPFEVLAARRLIEPEVCAIAARVATDGAIDAILAPSKRWSATTTSRPATSWPTANSTSAIARATGNSALVGTIAYLWEQRGRLWHRLKEHFQTEELRQETLTDHRRIFAAIAATTRRAAQERDARPPGAGDTYLLARLASNGQAWRRPDTFDHARPRPGHCARPSPRWRGHARCLTSAGI